MRRGQWLAGLRAATDNSPLVAVPVQGLPKETVDAAYALNRRAGSVDE